MFTKLRLWLFGKKRDQPARRRGTVRIPATDYQF